MKTAIVTGAGSGLGLELCRTLQRHGYRLAMHSRNAAQLEVRSASLRRAGEVMAASGDVGDAESLRGFVRSVEQAWGPIDLAIANAGIRGITRASGFPLPVAVQIMQTNYFGMLNLFDAVMPAMLARRAGCFAGVASIAGIRCLAGGSAYGASKAAMQAFLDTTRLDVRGSGVRIVTVNPWFVRTREEDDRVRRPMQVGAEWAAERIVRGIEAGRTQIEFPLAPSLAWKVIRMLPNAVFVRLFGARG